MRIGIVGARLAGSYAALLLSAMGHEVLLFDPSTEREKPCGGGVTPKALLTMEWFRHISLPHNEIRYMQLRSPEAGTSTVRLRCPIRVFSRSTLDSALRDAALRGGTRFIEERANRFFRDNGGWSIATPRTEYEVDFLVGADGATSSVRSAVTAPFSAGDVSLALGYYLPGLHHPDSVVCLFQERGFQGYLWSFPRVDHCAIGILRRLTDANAASLRQRVERFIDAEFPRGTSRRFYAARIPCLGGATLAAQRTAGDSWALLGDAGGFVDAITAEGIFYALRSAELLADAFRAGNPCSFEQRWRLDFGRELYRAARWRDRFYAGTFLLRSLTCRTVQILRTSETGRRLTDSLVSGSRGYAQLARQLVLRSPVVLVEAIAGRLRRPGPAADLLGPTDRS